ncbi:MAG: phosphate ABC transporter permease subunit PstC [Anaerolineales bacterium]|nr:phosphate ABC transporter permease subunit PstC [Anaerolineales bacterium]MDW8161118.1 phosphate ABC transporter permease subunit PstC [Anaerolineales bacterium]
MGEYGLLMNNLRILRSRRAKLDSWVRRIFWMFSALPFLLVLTILTALWLKAQPLLLAHPLSKLLLGEAWRPQKGEFGFLPFISGTIWVTGVALFFAVPICILTAVYLSEYASGRVQRLVKPLLDLLAAIPSVVYGVWGVLTIVPWVEESVAPALGRWGDICPIFASANPTGYSVLAGGVVLAVMIAPFIVAIAYEVLQTVPAGLRQASLALGATRWQTVKYAVLPRASTGIFASVILGCSRALGETMAVLMVAGNVAQVPRSIFDAAYPLPALIANNYGEMMSIPLYDAALMTASLILFLIVLALNIFSILALRHVLRESE